MQESRKEHDISHAKREAQGRTGRCGGTLSGREELQVVVVGLNEIVGD